jgi:subtilisin family serine protease
VVDDTKATWRLRVNNTDEDAPLDVANALAEEPGVDFAEPNALQPATYAALALPMDTLFQNQWHLHNTGQGGGIVGADVRALEAWEITTGAADIRVVVHDSGVDINHPDLQANMAPGKDFDNDDEDASNHNGPHGTACAGVIAAVGNHQGVIGVAPGCRIVPLRAAGAHTWNTWAETFEWAAAHGDIISCSWSLSRNSTLTEAIQQAAREGRGGKGTAIFFATGNSFISSISYPASLPETIAVGASTNSDRRAGYSQFGDGIDFVAPSSGGTLRIETTDIQGAFGYNAQSNGDYCKATDATGFGGTSSATPLAAGVAALMLSVNPNLTAEQVRAIMRDTCDKIDAENASYDDRGWSEHYGYGRVNAAAAVRRAQDLLDPARPTSPSKQNHQVGKGVGNMAHPASRGGFS